MDPSGPQFGLLCAPRPLTRKALQVFLHELAHFVLHSDGKRRKVYLMEFECEQWALARMREAGIAIPRTMTKRAKEYVRYKIYQADARGCQKFDPKALKFAGLKLQRPESKKDLAARLAASQTYQRSWWEKVPAVLVRFQCPNCGSLATMSARACFLKEVMIGCPECEDQVWMKPKPEAHFKSPSSASGSMYF